MGKKSIKSQIKAALAHRKRTEFLVPEENLQESDGISESYGNLENMIAELTRPQSSLAAFVSRGCLSKIYSDPWVRFFKGERVTFPYYEMESIVAPFYKLLDTYIGTDSLLPSDFISRVHPYLLDYLVSTLHQPSHYPPASKYCHGRHLVRILPIELKKLQNDFEKNKSYFRQYLNFHVDKKTGKESIVLLWVDPSLAKAESEERGMWTTDVGLWPRNCALMFQSIAVPEREIELQLVNPRSQNPAERTLFETCIDYTKSLIGKSHRLRCNDDIGHEPLEENLKQDLTWSLEAMKMVQPELAEVWPAFVNGRMAKREGRFLGNEVLKSFKKPPRIFDAASGIGAETVWLKKRKYDVTSNEIFWDFMRSAFELASELPQAERDYEIWAYDWRHLKEDCTEDQFDVVLVLGNSLTCLLGLDAMEKCLHGFHHILKRDGVLVIDTRNYRNMFDNSSKCLGKSFRFRQEVVYPSKEIRAKPGKMTKISNVMLLEYYDNGNCKGTWEVYAFNDHELKRLLEKTGLFRVEKTYYDFLKRPSKRKPAEFITYIARANK